MIRRLGVLFLLIIFSFINFLPSAVAVDGDVVITEIGAYEGSDHEWIEIYNRGSDPVDLTGWKFFEDGTNHGLSAFRGEMIIAPGAYAIIADVASNTALDYPAYTGAIIDSSWSTLNESGETIALKSSTGIIVEQFTYVAAGNHSLERVDVRVNDYTAVNWREHVSSNTIGAVNSVALQSGSNDNAQTAGSSNPASSQETPNSANKNVSDQGTQTQTSGTTTTPIVAPVTPPVWHPVRGDVLINELVSDPTDGEKEWIEIYNRTDREVVLDGWIIEEGSRAVTALSGKLNASGAGKFLVVDGPKGNLNNAGDVIILRDESRGVIDEVAYGNWDDGNASNNAPRADDPNSLARMMDGANTFNNASDFLVTTTPTKGVSNRIVTEQVIGGSTSSAVSTQVFVKDIVISEVYPNPVGDEVVGEFIEIYNTGVVDIDLNGWQVVNGAGKKYTINSKDFPITSIKSGEYFVIPRKISGISLKNTGGDSVKLYQSSDTDKPNASIYYREKAAEGESYASDIAGDRNNWRWTSRVTMGLKNEFILKNSAPDVVIDIPTTAIVGEVVLFDASDTSDADKNIPSYDWSFGDGTSAQGVIVMHAYDKKGEYEVGVTVRDGVNVVNEKRRITVSDVNVDDDIGSDNKVLNVVSDGVNSGVIINEVYPNPELSEQEFVELINMSDGDIDLSGWSLETVGGKRYTLPSGVVIASQGYFVVTRDMSKITLANSGEVLGLVAPGGEIVDLIEYEYASRGFSFSRDNIGAWLWSTAKTPGSENVFSAIKKDDSSLGEGGSNKKTGGVKKSSITYISTSLENIRELAKGSMVSVRGVVSVEPNILGKNIFYLAGSGIQVYVSSGVLPKILVGDVVEVHGSLSETGGESRILVSKTRGKISVVEHGELSEPHAVATGDIAEDLEGSLVSVSGVITKAQWPQIYVDDGSDEVRVYIKKTTGIEKMKIKIGDKLNVVGVVSETTAGYRILPRYASDIVTIKDEEVVGDSQKIVVDSGAASPLRSYAIITAIALGVLSVGLIFQYRRDRK